MNRRTARETARATTSSAATTPRPSQSGRYHEPNGTSASRRPSFANGSRTDVATCEPRRTRIITETFRCSVELMYRGQTGDFQRTVVPIPITTLAVSSSIVTAPVARSTYHSGLGAAVRGITAPPPASRRPPPPRRPGRRGVPAGRARLQAGGRGDRRGPPRALG